MPETMPRALGGGYQGEAPPATLAQVATR